MIDLARLGRTTSFHHNGWAYDAHPELDTLDAGHTITVADVEGPGVVTNLHLTMLVATDHDLSPQERIAVGTRGVVLRVFYEDHDALAVQVPVGDFFADGCGGRGTYFTTPFVEKAPASYNSYLPMPFRGRVRIELANDTIHDLRCDASVEIRHLPELPADVGYLHATWRRFAFQLDGDSDVPFLHIDGRGHLVGTAWSIATDEEFFEDFWFVTEGNNEYRVDGESIPGYEYLGTEDAYGMSWGFLQPFAGSRSGANVIERNRRPYLASLYRFRDQDAIAFERSLDLRVNWTREWRPDNPHFLRSIAPLHAGRQMVPVWDDDRRGWIDYATTFHWYQQHIGHPHTSLPTVADRTRTVLVTNSTDA